MTNSFGIQPQGDAQRTLMYVIYGLFGAAVLTSWITAIAGVIVAYLKRDALRGGYYHDHIRFLIRTFWGAVAGFALGSLLAFIIIGIPLIYAVVIWYLFRVIYGFIRLTDNQTVTTTGWFM